MTSTDALAILGAVTGILGAITGVLALAWQIATRRLATYKVKVRCTSTVLLMSSGEWAEPMLAVTAHNVGGSSVDVVSWGVDMGGKRGGFTAVRP